MNKREDLPFAQSPEHTRMPALTLDQLKIGESARVSIVGGTTDVRRRLMEMGIIPGTVIRVVRFAPLGDPMDVEVRGYHLSLRKQEAHEVALTRD